MHMFPITFNSDFNLDPVDALRPALNILTITIVFNLLNCPY